MSVVPRCRSIAALSFAVVLAAVMLSVSIAPGAPTSTGSAPGPRTLTTPDPCPGAMLPHNYTGTVADVGGTPPPSVSLNYSYAAVETTNLTNGVVLSSVCTTENQTAVVNGVGDFRLSIDPTPVANCTIPKGGIPGKCIVLSGPYEQVDLTPTHPLAPGDFASVAQNGTSFQVRLYPYLATVRLEPGAPSATYSPGGVEEFRADPLTGAGTPTPMAPQFSWGLAGTGWTFAAPPDGSGANITAAVGAGIGNLSVVATLNVTGRTLVTPPDGVELLAVATSISSASLDRTVVDVGQPVNVRLDGTASAGYQYTGTVDPGLGEPPETATCDSVPGDVGTVVVSCAATLNYTVTGVAQPAATVSNGVSSAVWEFPEVTVNPAPALGFSPLLPVGYAGDQVPVSVQAVPGTGTAPYAGACLSTGTGATDCSRSPGPSWTFAPLFSETGNYTVTAWTTDATGVIRSATTAVRVVAPLSVSLRSDPATGSAGTPLFLTALVSGGDLPGRVWWNATGATNPVASAWITTDGTVEAVFVPPNAEYVTVSVAVVDGLDTVASAQATWTIGVGAAVATVPVVLPPTSPIRAGAPFGVAWQAIDSGGDVVHSFASEAEVELVVAGSSGAAPGWVNASGVGSLPSRLPGWFDVPAAAWIGGDLNVSVTSRVAGSIQVLLAVAAGIPSADGTVGVVVLPDIDHLKLFDPRTTLAGDRTNDTLWQVSDRFGNAATGASMVVTTSFDGSTTRTLVPVLPEPSGATEVWANYSVPDAWAGTVTVTDLAGDALVPTVLVPGLSGPWASLAPLPLLVGVGAGAVAGAIALGRRRSRRARAADTPRDEEAELQRLAEGRATVVELVRRSGPLDLAGVATTWEPPPAPPDLADWIASLLTDGTLDASFGADGVARFFVAPVDAAPARVTLDLDAFERAQRRRDAVTADPGPEER